MGGLSFIPEMLINMVNSSRIDRWCHHYKVKASCGALSITNELDLLFTVTPAM